MIKGLVAIIGRPNVGKSTLFNRMTKSSRSIVDDQPGVTRDRIFGVVNYNDEPENGFALVDTGGFETKDVYYQPFTDNLVWQQTQQAIEEADVVLLVFDAKTGLHPHDHELYQYAKSTDKKVLFVVNKVDGKEQQSEAMEFYQLGIDHLHFVSSAHNRGVWELCDVIEQELEVIGTAKQRKPQVPGALRIAVIGRPNAGKSSIVNRLIGENRSLVSDVAGTTRDTLDTPIKYGGKDYVILDTAGIRRRSKIKDKIESISIYRSLQTIENADIVVMVVTPEDVMCDQDARLASLTAAQFKPLLIVVNKWDLVPDKDTKSAKKFEDYIRAKLQDISFAPILFTSALTNQRVAKIMAEVEKLAESYQKRVSTSLLNETLAKAVHGHTPALIKKHNKRVKFYYATQVRQSPPTIVIMCNVADEIQESYKRYLTHKFRHDLGFKNIPLRLLFRGKAEQRAKTDSPHSVQ